MPTRTYEINGLAIEFPSDLEEIVKDKRERFRSTFVKSKQRQRRYKKRLIKQLLKQR